VDGDDEDVEDELDEPDTELEGELEELVSVEATGVATEAASSALPRSLLEEPFELETAGFEAGLYVRDFPDFPGFVWLVVLEVEFVLNVLDVGVVLDDEEGGDVYVFMSVNLITDFPG
jgi:hypothetical protein